MHRASIGTPSTAKEIAPDQDAVFLPEKFQVWVSGVDVILDKGSKKDCRLQINS